MMNVVYRKVLGNCLPSQSVVVSSMLEEVPSAYRGPQGELGSSLPIREDGDDEVTCKSCCCPLGAVTVTVSLEVSSVPLFLLFTFYI